MVSALSKSILVRFRVNGRDRQLEVEPRVSLLDALRERLGLFGTKKGCDHGQCGACTVLVDDRRILSCLTLAVQADGKRVTTIEGLADGDRLHPRRGRDETLARNRRRADSGRPAAHLGKRPARWRSCVCGGTAA